MDDIFNLEIEVSDTPKLSLNTWSIDHIRQYAVITPAGLVIFRGDLMYPDNEPVLLAIWRFALTGVQRSTTKHKRNIERRGFITKDGTAYVLLDDSLFKSERPADYNARYTRYEHWPVEPIPLTAFRKMAIPSGIITDKILKTEFRKLIKSELK